MHGIVEGLLPLLDRVDEPFGGIDLLFDKSTASFWRLSFLLPRSYSFSISL
jgi:hypothetical protein